MPSPNMIFYKCYVQVKEPRAFRMWRETMFSNLQGWQDKLLRGPMWSGCTKEDQGRPLTVKLSF